MRTLPAYEFRTLLEARRRSLLSRPHQAAEVEIIEAALDRLAKGRYGLCAGCGEEIDRSRLKFDPVAERCSRCRGEE